MDVLTDAICIHRLDKQGFQSPPNRKFVVDGKVAGNWGTEVSCVYSPKHILSLLTSISETIPVNPQFQPLLPSFHHHQTNSSQRGLSYHHILHAGHAVPTDQPAVTFAYVRDFVLGVAGY